MTMHEPSDNRRRLAALAGLAVLWGALLVTIGFQFVLVVAAVVAAIGVATIALEGRHLFAATSARIARIDWAPLRDGSRRTARATARLGRQGATVARDAAAAGSRHAVAAGKAARKVQLPALPKLPQLSQLPQLPQLDQIKRPDARREARKLNERAAACRQAGRVDEAIALGEQALEVFRGLGDRHGEALTLNGLGLAQARIGDEAAALDSYETAVELLTVLGDSHGAGRVLANLGALHRGQGHDEQARACLHDALERFEPGSVEHDRTAQQLRLAG